MRTIESELDGHPLSEERMEEIAEYILDCFWHSRSVDTGTPLPINGRFILAMIKELRDLRAIKAALDSLNDPQLNDLLAVAEIMSR